MQTNAELIHDKCIENNYTLHRQYDDTIWIPAARRNNRHRACPNISFRPELDSARQKDGQGKIAALHCMFAVCAYDSAHARARPSGTRAPGTMLDAAARPKPFCGAARGAPGGASHPLLILYKAQTGQNTSNTLKPNENNTKRFPNTS